MALGMLKGVLTVEAEIGDKIKGYMNSIIIILLLLWVKQEEGGRLKRYV